jgi:membrane glycosyltransferase
MGLVMAGGLHPMSRMHFLMGVMSYVASPLWLIFLVAGLFAALHEWFFAPSTLMEFQATLPGGDAFDTLGALRLMALSLALLWIPRLMGMGLLMADREESASMGGRFKLVLSVMLEGFVSTLMAPVMMLFQSHFVFGTLFGYKVNWSSQQREDTDLPWSEALRRHKWHMVIGVVLAALTIAVAPGMLAWLSPVILGLWLAPAISVFTSRASLGLWLQRRGLLLIPEEVQPPTVLVRAQELAEEGMEPVDDALDHVLTDPRAHALHLALLESHPAASVPAALASARRKLLAGGVEPLSPQEKSAVLLDARTLSELRGRRLGAQA